MKRRDDKEKTEVIGDSKSKTGKGQRPFKKGRISNGLDPKLSKGPNDIAWRTSSPLSVNAGNLPFGFPSGLRFPAVIARNNGGATPYAEVPGILALRLILTAGSSADYNSAVNLAARQIYSYVRHANSGSKNYEASDLMMYLLSFEQPLGLLGYLQRLYRAITTFSSTNRYYPRELVRIMGVDYDDIKQHQAELAWLIKWLGNSLNALAVPRLDIFEAAYYTFSHVFEDSTSPKHQIYLFVPDCFGIYSPTYNTNGGGVDFTNSATAFPAVNATVKLTYSDLFTMTHAIMDVLLSDEDIGIISGDIMKAYGDKLFTAVPMDDTPLTFEHSEEVLQQIHNATCCVKSEVVFKGYKQNPGTTSTAPFVELDLSAGTVTFNATDYHFNTFAIDAFSAVPDYKEVFNCCVLKHFMTLKLVSTTYYPDLTTLSFGMYLVRDIIIATGVGSNYVEVSVGRYYGTCDVGTPSDLQYMYAVCNFDWHPLSYVMDQIVWSGSCRAFGDAQNLQFFDPQVLSRILDTSMLSLFNFNESSK